MRGEFEELVDWLSNPRAYPNKPAHVEVVETHISIVFIAGDEVFKLKKPVKYEFLDFTTLDARQQACRDEVRLNRRLTKDVYLGVVPVARHAVGNFEINGAGDIVDWLVHMRRLPTERTLDALHRLDELRPEHIVALSQILAKFYRGLSSLPISASDYRQRYRAHILANQQELLAAGHHCARNAVRRIHAFQLQLLELQAELLEERSRLGRVVEGHGDLRPEHICFTEPLAIFDCLEFSFDLRRIDVADELCFLSAECDFIGANWVGPLLFERFRLLTGDRPPPVLLAFYKSYRACVRAKVTALRADQIADTRRFAVAAEVLKHLDLADSYVQPWTHPMILIIGGLSGTGKSTLAAEIARRLGCELLRTDVIRKELHLERRDSASYGAGNYERGLRQRVYEEMLHRAGGLHAEGVSLVLDGTFSMATPITEVRRIASRLRTSFLAIECYCSQETVRRRIGERLDGHLDASEAKPEFYDRQQEQWDAWAADLPQCRVNTEQPLDKQINQVLTELRQRSHF